MSDVPVDDVADDLPLETLEAVERAADQLGVGVLVVRVEADLPRIVHVSSGATRILGRSLKELITTSPWSIVPADELSRVRETLEDRNQESPPIVLQVTTEHPDGRRSPTKIGIARVQTNHGTYAVGLLEDVSADHAAAEALRRSEERFRFLVEKAPDGVVILQQGRIVFINPTAVQLLGAGSAEAAIGQFINAYLPPADAARTAERIGEMMRSGKDFPPSEYGVLGDPDRRVEIKSIPCDWEGRPSVIAFARDVTERAATQRDLARADRLAAVGTLAAGVAHEINNPLTYAQLSLQRLEAELAQAGLSAAQATRMRELIGNARDGTQRVATIVRDLRTFAHPDETPSGPVDLVAAAETALRMAENDLRHRAKVIRRFAEGIPAVDANASRLEQVFLNLIINAMQALPADDPDGQIIVEIVPGTGEVIARVSDTGIGIEHDRRNLVFEPFYTTKAIGEGTGLGLSVCKGIIDGFGGEISVSDGPRGGTTFTIRLPIFRPRATAQAPVVPVPPSAVTVERLRILIVDDEPLVRRMMSLILAPHHEVITVDGSTAALTILEHETFDVVLCDLLMPKVSGKDLYDALAARHPGAERRVVFVTGGAFVPHLAAFFEQVDNPKLLKPFSEEQVLAAVQVAAARR